MRALDADLVQPPRPRAEGDRAEGLARRDLGPQDRIAVFLGIGAQRPTAVDHRHAERLQLLFPRGGERLVEDGAGLSKRQCHRVSP
jgi:hypothetical protein